MSDARLVDSIASRQALESLNLECAPAAFEPTKGARAEGLAGVAITRSSIAIRFAAHSPMNVEKAAYGEANGRIVPASGAWMAPKVNDVGSADGVRVFNAPEVVLNLSKDAIAATRLVFAGAAWSGAGDLDGRRIVVAPLTSGIVSHHDARVSIAVEGELDEATMEAIGRAGSFVAGLDLELLRVDSFSASGDFVRTRHLRGFRRVGRGPHSPFVGIAEERMMQAFVALASSIPKLTRDGVPVVTMINCIGSHNAVAEINAAAPLLLLATQTAAYHRLHGHALTPGAISRKQELAILSRDLGLGLTDEDLERFDKLRVELMDTGFFHAPGYETGRPQKDIKFLRDIAHMVVFRLCGYTGPFYGAETFAERQISAQ